MLNNELNPKLTILIPTRNRAKSLKNCLNRMIKAINFAKINENEVEILVVDNFSKDETRSIVDLFSSKHNFIKYYHHIKPYSCAEESILHSFSQAKGDFVWTFGDDDYMHFSGVKTIVKLINDYDYKLIILNTAYIINRKKINFINFNNKDISILEYSSAKKMFFDLGFMHITTGLPLLCFKRSEFDCSYFKNAVEVSAIYSLSFSLLASFHKSKCLFIAQPLVVMTENKINDEFNRLSKLATRNNHMPRYYWSSGIVSQISLLSSRINLDLGYILNFREIIIDRVFYKNFELHVLEFIFSFFINDLKDLNKKYFLLRYKNNINNDLGIFLQIFDSQIINALGVNDIKEKLIKIKKYTNKNILFFLFSIGKIKKIIKQITPPDIRKQITNFNEQNFRNNNQILLKDNLKLFHAKIKKLNNL